MEYVGRRIVASHYDGTNSADVLAAAQTITAVNGNVYSIVGEDSSGMLLREAAAPTLYYDWPIQPGYWIIVEPGFGIRELLTDPVFQAVYRIVSTYFLEATNSTAVVSSLKSKIYNQYENGYVALPSLLLGASTTLSVPLSGTFTDTNYTVKTRAIAGASIISALQVTGVVKSANSVSVTVKANGVATVAGVLLVDCFR